MAETDRLEDAYRFRTPSLRNIEITAPYGHNGAFSTLDGIIRHHLNPIDSYSKWNPDEANLPLAPSLAATDFVTRDDSREQARLLSNIDIKEITLSDSEITHLISFLKALTGRTSLTGRLGKPLTVPSGLEVE